MKKKSWDGWTNKEVKYLKHLRTVERKTINAIGIILTRSFASVNGKLRSENVYLPGRQRRHKVFHAKRSRLQIGV